MKNKSYIFAATDATFIEMDFPVGMQSTPTAIMKFGKTYHLLTPEYWAWFNHKYHIMEQALLKKIISEATFEEILDRIAAMYVQALEIYGADVLKEAEATTDIKEWEKSLLGTCKQPAPQKNVTPAVSKPADAVSPDIAATQTTFIF